MTARGWEDLSALLLTYEALGFACMQTQAREYLHVQEAAAGFAAFYELYRRYAASLPLETLLRGQTDAGAEALRGLPFEGRLSVVEFLLTACKRSCARWRTHPRLRSVRRAF